MVAYDFARRLNIFIDLTPNEYIVEIWMSEPDWLIVDPIHQMLGLHT